MIEIRDLREEDCEQLSSIICDVWTMESYGEDVAMPGSRMYLYSCIDGCGSRKVAVVDGEVVGCAMTRSVGDSGPDMNG